MKLFLSCPKGLEQLLYTEIEQLGVKVSKQTVAGIYSEQLELEDIYRICLWSRLANRVLLPIHQAKVETVDELYMAVQQINWLEHMRSEGSLLIDFTGQNQNINNTHFGALKVKDAIVDQIRQQTGSRPSINKKDPDLRINVCLHRGKVSIALDLSGESLHRRGYRLQAGEAPMKENLAAAMLIRSGLCREDVEFDNLLDPLCGAGTLIIEAAMMLADIAPGLNRKQFGFSRWTQHRASLWSDLLAEAQARKQFGLAKITINLIGLDKDKQVIEYAKNNAERAGVSSIVNFRAARLESLSATELPAGKGLLITNPPYGERLGDTKQLMFLYQHLGGKLKQQFSGWTAAVFSSNPDLCKTMGLRAEKDYQLFNGALKGQLSIYPIANSYRKSVADVEQDSMPLSAGAEMLVNRLTKNKKKLAKWLKRENISCYRLYDADIPEYAVAVDVYADRIYVQEYAPPASIDAVKAFTRLNEVMQAVPVALNLSAEQIVLKQRKKQQGNEQYTRYDNSQKFIEVEEQGCRLLVNLHDYLDTGLFLDHRPLRRIIGQQAKNKDMLNLFCYTATASIHAAKGGARSTTSIDMSATYLNWARRNFELNGFENKQHQHIQADCMHWLRQQTKPVYDLIFMDPPTFSNSKRMEGVLDVQRDHIDLINDAMRLLRPEGVLYFSSNYRRFKLDYAALSAYKITDITKQTIDPDFARNSRIHCSFKIEKI